MPIVVVEAERPSMQRDLTAAITTQSSLEAIGIRAIHGEAARSNRRPLADAAVTHGMPEGPARAAIDHLDGDFIARIESTGSVSAVESVYGVDVARAELTLAVTVLHGLRESVVRSFATSVRRQSRSPSTAQSDVQSSAAHDAAVAIAGTIALEWIAIGQNERPWIVEVRHPDSAITGAMAEHAFHQAKVLEYRPGIRALLEMPESQALAAVQSGSLGQVLLTRPGLVRIQALGGEANWKVAWIIAGAAIASGAGTLLLSRVRSRTRRASVDSR